METVLIWVAVVVIGAIAVVLAYAATRPDEFHIARSTSIVAPPEKIFPLVNDLRSFNQWNPFAKQDPTAQITYNGPPGGKGASHAWNSKGRAGKGSLEIVDTAPPSGVTMMLRMEKPMKADNTIVFALRPNGSATDVTWTMSGISPYIAKVMGVIINCDRMVGGEFEKGLADLKALAER